MENNDTPKKFKFRPRTDGKPSQAEVEKRITTAAKLILQGYNRYDLMEYFEKEFGLVSSTASLYYTKGLERIREINREEIRKEVHYELQRLETLYKECMDVKDRKTAASVAKQIADLKGFQQATLLEIQNENNENKLTINIIKPK